MNKLIHIWVDDNINRGLLDNNYTDMKWYQKRDGGFLRMDCKYQGHDTTVYFYTSEQAKDEWIARGMVTQKVVINSPVKEEVLLLLRISLRSQTLPREGVYPTEEKFVMEIGDGWKILDAHKGGTHREFRSFKEVSSAEEFLGLAKSLGCPMDK